MANKLTPIEAESISMLQSSNPGAFKVMIAYFARKYEFEAKKCVETPKDKVERHQGRAMAFEDAACIYEDAMKKLNS